jgi:hypothetical protein
MKRGVDMSRRTIVTCNNCGIERDDIPPVSHGWRDPKVFYVTDNTTAYTSDIDLCPTCVASFKDALDVLGGDWAGAIIAHASRKTA